MRLLEACLVLFVLWVLVNVMRAVAYKTSHGGGFWGLANWMTQADRQKEFNAAVLAEVERQLKAASCGDLEQPQGQKGEAVK